MNHNYNLCNPPSPGCPNWEDIMYGMSQSELLEYTSKPYQTGPDQFFPLIKKVISNESAKEKLNSPFNEVTISEEKFDSEKIKGIYNDLFYLINKKGKKSHTSIIEQSTDYVWPEINQNLDDKISSLEEEMVELNSIYISGSLPQITPQHPIYNNGVLIQNGDTTDNAAIDPSSTIFYIQQGFKRPITHSSRGYYVRALRQAEGETVYKEDGSMRPLNESPNFRFLSNDDLNLIPNGEDIDSAASLNLETITDQGPNYTYDEIKMIIKCEGVEQFYMYGIDHPFFSYNIMEGYPEKGGYWYIDKNASCKVKIAYPNLSAGWRTIPGGGDLTLKISRDDKFYGHTINGTSDPLDYGFYQGNHQEKVSRSGYNQALPPLHKWKRWGEKSPFPSILGVKPGSRLTYRVLTPYNSTGQIIDGGKSHWLNGTMSSPEQSGDAIQQGHPEQAGLFISTYNMESAYGTKILHNDCSHTLQVQEGGCYGNLGQSDKLQELLNDPTFNYYRSKVTGGDSGINMYGQPILKVKGKFAVFLYRFRKRRSVKDWNRFYYIESGDFEDIRNKHTADHVNGYKRYSHRWFDWANVDGYTAGIGFGYGEPGDDGHLAGNDLHYMNNPTIYFPGLKGANLNSSGTNHEGLNVSGDNPFNTKSHGSNFYDHFSGKLKRG